MPLAVTVLAQETSTDTIVLEEMPVPHLLAQSYAMTVSLL